VLQNLSENQPVTCEWSNLINQKKLFMKYPNQLEVILFTKYSLTNLHQKELVKWLGTTAQSAIGRQDEKAKKINLPTLKQTPAIYMS
jgi:hypothetical protein